MQRVLNNVFICVLCLVLIGSYLYQFLEHTRPCELCLLQRLAMIAIAASLMLNLRFGIKTEHYGLAMLASLSGLAISLRQMSLHISGGLINLTDPLLGVDLYVWASLVFCSSIIAIAILLILYGYQKHQSRIFWTSFEKSIFGVLFILCLANVVTTFYECGLSTCGH